MRNYLLGGLVVLNLILLLAVGARVLHLPQAQAQVLGLSGNYLMVNGQILGAANDVVYLIDLPTRTLSALYYDRTTHEVSLVSSRDLVRDLGIEQPARTGGPVRRPPARPR